MELTTDIRDLAHLSGKDAQKLNFINESGRYIFRKYYRSGLRSHIFEVISAKDVLKETRGEIEDGIRVFPRARPKKMFRILRNRFETSKAVFNEIEKYRLLLRYFGPDFIAQSEEVIVSYTGTGTHQIVLCGLQEYVQGDILDPWRVFDKACLSDFFRSEASKDTPLKTLVETAEKNIAVFVKQTRRMINETGYIPDLAGLGNLMLTPHGSLKLVDINNIVHIRFDDSIPIDDKGYPSCDVSVEVLSILEWKIHQKKIPSEDPLYHFFLSPERKKKVTLLEKNFYKTR